MPKATLIFADGATRTFAVASAETVVRAAMRERLMLLTDCREGACGTCRANCLHGDFTLDDYSTTALPDPDRKAGAVLMCRMRIDADCVIELDYPLSAVSRGPAVKPRPVTIVSVEPIAVDAIELVVEAADGRPFDFLPGQYANLATPDGALMRSYSFASAPGTHVARFLVRLLPAGAMSGWLAGIARPGMSLSLDGPYGRFFIRDPLRPLLFVAGGTGLAPVLSMLRHLAAGDVAVPRIDLVFGANTPAGLFKLDELDALGRQFENFHQTVTVAQGGPDWRGMLGTTADALAGFEPHASSRPSSRPGNWPGASAYLCGPPAMIEHCAAVLRACGIGDRDMVFEAFLPTAQPSQG